MDFAGSYITQKAAPFHTEPECPTNYGWKKKWRLDPSFELLDIVIQVMFYKRMYVIDVRIFTSHECEFCANLVSEFCVVLTMQFNLC